MKERRIELISFAACPYVQRSAITLIEKGVTFDTTFIDLKNKPSWFLELSPTGKVPVLRIDDNTLFESAVINEYLDETNPPSIHPKDPFEKAKHRAWIEFTGVTIDIFFGLLIAEDRHTFERRLERFLEKLDVIEDELGKHSAGPLFSSEFCLVDAAIAPLFLRMSFISDSIKKDFFESRPRLRKWNDILLRRKSVIESTPEECEADFIDYIQGKMSYMSGLLS